MGNLNYNILKQRQKMYIKAYAILCLVIFLSMGFYSFVKWREYSAAKEAVAANRNYISALGEKLAEEKSDYEDKKADFDDLHEKINEKLESIFPGNDAYTDMTRTIDSYEAMISTKNNPFEVSHIDFQTPSIEENYAILPMRMSIRSSGKNFTKFLHLVEGSGSLNDGVRLMDISSIRLNFQESGNEEDLISFTVQINAYFRK